MKKILVFLSLILGLSACFIACDMEDLHIHKYGEWTVTKEPTDTEEGEQVRYCDCGKEDVKSIPAK